METRYLYQEIFVDHLYGGGKPLDLPTGSCVIDAGANIGLFARYVIDRQPSVRLLCAEPAPEPFQAIVLNMRELQNVEVRNCALGVNNGEVRLCYYPAYSMMSTLHPDPVAAAALIAKYTKNTSTGLDPEDQRGLFDG